MKRSAAPSGRSNPGKRPLVSMQHVAQSQPAQSLHSEHVPQRSQSQEEVTAFQSGRSQAAENNSSASVEGTRNFAVVYAKASNRKHKRWEGDGFLEVQGGKMRLRTEDVGRPVVASGALGELQIVPNARFHVGSYEVEVQEELSENVCAEYLLFCPPTDLQLLLYQTALDIMTLSAQQMIDFLLRTCNHPALLLARVQQIIDGGDKSRGIAILRESFPPTCLASDCFLADSNKLLVLFHLVTHFDDLDEKTIIMSSSRSALELIQAMLEQALFEVLRLDTEPPSVRQDLINKFNKPSLFDSPNQVLLMHRETRTMGRDLTGSTRLIMLDSDWSGDAVERAQMGIWRNGQRKTCHVYRLLMTGSIEEKMLQGQHKLTNHHLGAQSPTNFSDDALAEIFEFSLDSACDTHKKLRCKCGENGTEEAMEVSDSPDERTKNTLNMAMGETQFTDSLQDQIHTDQEPSDLMNWRHFQVDKSNDNEEIQEIATIPTKALDHISFIMIKEPNRPNTDLNITRFIN